MCTYKFASSRYVWLLRYYYYMVISSSVFFPQGKVKARRLRNMLSSLNVSALGPCSSPQYRSPTGRTGSLELRSFAALTHGHNTGVAAMGKVIFSLATEGRMAL